MTNEQQLSLFRLLRSCIAWTVERKPKPFIVPDPVARIIFDRLWQLNYGLAVSGAMRYGPVPFSSDAVQDALLGLHDGLLRFDPDRGVMPSTYLMWWIRRAVYHPKGGGRYGVISLSRFALRRIKDGEIEKPVVLSYHAVAHRLGMDEIENARFMNDRVSAPPDDQVDVKRLFHEWSDKLRSAAAHVERDHQVEYLLFSLDSGYGRFPKGPVRMKALKRLTGLKKGEIRKSVHKVYERIGKYCGFRDPRDVIRIVDAMVEYSLHFGIPL